MGRIKKIWAWWYDGMRFEADISDVICCDVMAQKTLSGKIKVFFLAHYYVAYMATKSVMGRLDGNSG